MTDTLMRSCRSLPDRSNYLRKRIKFDNDSTAQLYQHRIILLDVINRFCLAQQLQVFYLKFPVPVDKFMTSLKQFFDHLLSFFHKVHQYVHIAHGNLSFTHTRQGIYPE